MACSFDLTITNLVFLGALAFVVKKLHSMYKQWKVEKLLDKWTDLAPKDKVLLHAFARCKTVPSISPFVLKLETYLRLAKIPYELETEDFMGPKGKMPWITYNGTHVPDSHFCIEFLKKKFGHDMNKGKSAEILAAAHACRMVLESHFLWGMAQYRWIDNANNISYIAKFPTVFKVFMPFFTRRVKKTLSMVGIGAHTPTEIYQLTSDDLFTVSKILGNKKFLGGDSPCEDDCGVFGMIAQPLWAAPGSPYEHLFNNGELTNLKEYCERMKELAWPDWENCLDKF